MFETKEYRLEVDDYKEDVMLLERDTFTKITFTF